MFRATDIQDKLLHLIGWQPGYDPGGPVLKEELTESESGLYFQQAHPLITLKNLACIAPVGLEDEQFSDWLEHKVRGSIQKAITRFCTDNLLKGSYKTLCENKALFDGTGRIVDTVHNRHSVVGFEIVPVRAKGVLTRINKIGLQFTEPGDYTLYLFHSSQEEPMVTIPCTVTKKNSMSWTKVDVLLPYQSDDIDAGGSWYLVYSQESLPEGAEAIRKEYDWAKGPCSTCAKPALLNWQAWSKYLEIHPFAVEVSDVFNEEGAPQLWDVEKNIYDYSSNYGINLDVSVFCDYTDFIIEQRMLFADIIFKQVAVDFLREFAYNANVRTNRNSINASKLDILVALEGNATTDSFRQTGLCAELDKAFSALSLSLEGIDGVCQPCVNHGIKYRAI